MTARTGLYIGLMSGTSMDGVDGVVGGLGFIVSMVLLITAAQFPDRAAAVVLLAGLAYYFLGYDQGVVSVFGSDTHVHEFVHDARHFLGFPCH